MDVNVILSAVKGKIGRKVFFYERVESTNAVALEIGEGIEEGAVVISDGQEKGRGRLGRSWISPPEVNIYLSIILHPRIEPEYLTLITLMSAVSSARAIINTTGLTVTVKWPNDLMVADRKLGGILTEIKMVQKEVPLVVIGIGINVNMEMHNLPDEIRVRATSLKNETGKIAEREPIISGILNETDRWYALLQNGNRKDIVTEWQRLSATLGREVKVTSPQGTYKGLAEAVDDAGMLLLRLPSGRIQRINSGDLTMLK